VISLSTLALLLCTPAADPSSLKLNNGDCIVSIGSALIEREQRYGYWEAVLTGRLAGKNIRFRDLGWSGDTVFGEAQAGFGTPADGFRHLKDHVLALKPTVILVGYGSNEAFDGPAGLPHFTAGLNTLLDALAPTKARIVLLSPTRLENADRPLPDASAQNANVRVYTNAIQEIAKKRGALFVDLFDMPADSPRVTGNGLHLTPYGYWRTAAMLEHGLGWTGDGWHVDLDASGKVTGASGVKADTLAADRRSFRAVDTTLPLVPPAGSPSMSARVVRAGGLAPGSYTLLIDGKPNQSAPAEAWSRGVELTAGPELDHAERLRVAIVAKNQLYFHRWRPQNETYLFGFRKHEQGQNAREIPQFDPLVADAEKEIAKLSIPLPHTYELKRDTAK
jgi:lysophospholipase L1-like esterase